jgi:hypothetical protein
LKRFFLSLQANRSGKPADPHRKALINKIADETRLCRRFSETRYASGSIPVGNKIGILLNNAPYNAIGPFPTAIAFLRVAQPVGDPNVISGNASLTFDRDNANVISGNTELGIEIVGSGSTSEQIWGNLIGPDASGDRALPPAAIGDPTQAVQQTGIEINGATGNTIGGSGEPMNVISGNMVGVEFTEILAGPDVPSDTLINNVIGLGLDGNTLGNVIGVWVNDVPDTQIGLPGSPNDIAGNAEAGVYIIGRDASGNLVQGNVIGLGLDGEPHNPGNGADPTYPFPIGVYIQDSSSNTIGGIGDGEGNTISGNNVGVYIVGTSGSSTNNQVLRNSIGSPLSGGSGHGNLFYGVMLDNAPANNVPRSGPGANTIVASGIASFREYSGPVGTTKRPGVTQHAGSKQAAKKPVIRKSRGVHPSPGKKAPHHVAIVPSHVPAGPIRKARSQTATL